MPYQLFNSGVDVFFSTWRISIRFKSGVLTLTVEQSSM